MLLNRVKQSLAVLPSTSSAIAIQRSFVAIEDGNFFIAASIWPCCAFVHPSSSTVSPLDYAAGVAAFAAGFFC